MSQVRSSRRGSARAERIAKHRLPPEINPCPPGQLGGAYKPLADEQLRAIYEMALRLLAELGMGEVPPVLKQQLLRCGASKQGDQVVFPRTMVEKIIAMSASDFVFHGRDPKRSIHVGGKRVFFGTGNPPGTLATIIFGMPPLIRLTALGLRGVSESIKEAAVAFGASRWRLLMDVEIPLALPSIMTGVNQTILMFEQ